MARLTYAERQRLPASAFVFQAARRYPIPDAAHARDALSRVARFGTPHEKMEVCKAVHRRFPAIHAENCPIHRAAPHPTVRFGAHGHPAPRAHGSHHTVDAHTRHVKGKRVHVRRHTRANPR